MLLKVTYRDGPKIVLAEEYKFNINVLVKFNFKHKSH